MPCEVLVVIMITDVFCFVFVDFIHTGLQQALVCLM